jgi:hypothetical protein
MARISSDRVDFKAIGRHGTDDDRHLLARRAFAVWQPLFTHLSDKQYTHYVSKLVEDDSSAVLRGTFYRDAAGDDRGLVIVRIDEMEQGGRTVARMMIHLGLQGPVRGAARIARFIASETYRYRLRHPLRPFYIVDAPMSAASYYKLDKAIHELYPRPQQAIPDALWPMVEAVAREMEWVAIPGAAREARQVARTLTDQGGSDGRARSAAFGDRAAWFAEQTRGTPGSGLLAVAPLSYWNILLSSLKCIRGT